MLLTWDDVRLDTRSTLAKDLTLLILPTPIITG
jgi:hypothetical protein